MTWTYDPTNIGEDTEAGRLDSVRLLIGDTDTTDQKLQDEEIVGLLNQAGSDIYLAAALAARALGAKYAFQVDVKFETISTNYGQLSKNYYDLAKRLEQQAKKYGSVGLGIPVAGGISVGDMNSVNEDSDRVMPKFNRDQFAWPRPGYRGDEIL